MEPLTMGLLAGGTQLLGTFGNFFGQRDATNARNKAIAQQYRQQLKIREFQDVRTLAAYNLKKDNYNLNLLNRDKVFNLENMAEQMRMNELVKGSRFADQSDAINMSMAQGKVAARGMTGVSAARMQSNSIAQIGRNAAMRQERLTGQFLASDMKRQAMADSENATRQNMYNDVRFAPMFGPAPMKPTFEQGPSAMSLLTGIGGSILGGVQAGFGQQNYLNQFETGTPQQWQSYKPSFDLSIGGYGS